VAVNVNFTAFDTDYVFTVVLCYIMMWQFRIAIIVIIIIIISLKGLTVLALFWKSRLRCKGHILNTDHNDCTV